LAQAWQECSQAEDRSYKRSHDAEKNSMEAAETGGHEGKGVRTA